MSTSVTRRTLSTAGLALAVGAALTLAAAPAAAQSAEIGRASCRERVCHNV